MGPLQQQEILGIASRANQVARTWACRRLGLQKDWACKRCGVQKQKMTRANKCCGADVRRAHQWCL